MSLDTYLRCKYICRRSLKIGEVTLICQFLLMCEQSKSMTAQIVSAAITQSSNYISAAITRSGTGGTGK